MKTPSNKDLNDVILKYWPNVATSNLPLKWIRNAIRESLRRWSNSKHENQIKLITEAIQNYHYALDTRQHAGVAQDRAFNQICIAMGMQWERNAEVERRALLNQKGETNDRTDIQRTTG
jgi:hypothetical protein